MQISNNQARYELTDVARNKLIPPNIKYENDQLPAEFVFELVNMPPESPALFAGIYIDQAIKELKMQAIGVSTSEVCRKV